ncbi:hypothetical protein L1887_53380 [Cichorium endivia]|nr:hypothetical protein L1887_53380 [Cichorium endivia]
MGGWRMYLGEHGLIGRRSGWADDAQSKLEHSGIGLVERAAEIQARPSVSLLRAKGRAERAQRVQEVHMRFLRTRFNLLHVRRLLLRPAFLSGNSAATQKNPIWRLFRPTAQDCRGFWVWESESLLPVARLPHLRPTESFLRPELLGTSLSAGQSESIAESKGRRGCPGLCFAVTPDAYRPLHSPLTDSAIENG